MNADQAIDVVARRLVNDILRPEVSTLRRRFPGLTLGAYQLIVARTKELVEDPPYEELMQAHQTLSETAQRGTG